MQSSHSVVAENVRAEAARRSVRQVDLAETLGVTQQAISAKLAGRRPFTEREIAAVAARLGVAPGSLFESHVTGGAA